MDAFQGLHEMQFRHIDEGDRALIGRMIARIAEKSYRRGFQQGYDSRKRGDELCDLLSWRFEIDLDYSVSPHGTYHTTAEQRVQIECHLKTLGITGYDNTHKSTWDDIFFTLFKVRRKRRRTVSAKRRFEVLRRDGFKCVYCGVKASESELHVDHVMPVIDGGSDEMTNLVAACIDCNLGKGKTRL
jgi:hypothetical protein